MGARYREVGGGPAVGLANDWTSALQSLMGGGSTPGTQMVNAGKVNAQAGGPGGMVNGNGPGGIVNNLRDLFSQGGGQVGGHMASMINRSIGDQRQQLMSQFANIGGGQGSGAAQAVSRFNAGAADQVPLDIFNMQMSAMSPIMNYINQMAGKGISQRQGYMDPNPILQGITAAGNFLGQVNPFGSHSTAPVPQSTSMPTNSGGDGQGPMGMSPSAMNNPNMFAMPNLPAVTPPWMRNASAPTQNYNDFSPFFGR